MEKQYGLTLIEILISVAVAVLAIGGGFLLYNNFNELDTTAREGVPGEAITEVGEEIKQEVTEEESVAMNEEVTVDSRRTYTNEEYGFEISYPDDFEFGGPNPEEKLLFSLSGQSKNTHYEFWIQKLDGRTLEEVFEERLNLEDISYFDWIRGQGGEVKRENIGENEWLFIDGSAKFNLDSHYLLLIPEQDVYLIVDIGFPADSDLPTVKNILATLKIAG